MEDIPFVFDYKAYTIPLNQPIWLGSRQSTQRAILHIRLVLEGNRVAWGEVAPLPEWGSETMESALAFCKEWAGKKLTLKALLPILHALPACQMALESALAMPTKPSEASPSFEIAALLFPDTHILTSLEALLGQGFRTFKLKVAKLPFAEEKALIAAILSYLKPVGGHLRLDANGALDLETAKRYLDFLDTQPIAFLEQPLAAGQEAAMLALADQHTTPIAWDESIGCIRAIKAAEAKGFRGVYVIKPSILGSLDEFLSWREAGPAKTLVYSSAFESSLGIDRILRLAATDPLPVLPLGLGPLAYYQPSPLVWHSFGPKLAYTDQDSQHRSKSFITYHDPQPPTL